MMDAFDSKKAQRVWQRVQSTQPPASPQMEQDGLIAAAQTLKTYYLKLAQHGLSAESTLLKKLAEKKQAHSACLNGIRLLTTGHKYSAAVAQIPVKSPLAALRRCFTSEIRTLREYELRIADRDFGPIYTELAAEQRLICKILLELIGRLDKADNQPGTS